MALDWSSAAYGLNQLLVNPDVDYGDTDGSLWMLPPGAHMASVGFQDCCLR